MNYYELLHVPKDASSTEIRSSYRRLAMRWHPDKNPNNSKAEEIFKQVSEAYAVLSNPTKRQEYDNFNRYSPGDASNATSTSFHPNFNAYDSSEMFLQEMLVFAYELTSQNIKWSKIVPELCKKGCPHTIAVRIAQKVETVRKQQVRGMAAKAMMRAIFELIGGAILSVVLFEIGFLVLAGPILILSGIFNALRAAYYFISGRMPFTSS